MNQKLLLLYLFAFSTNILFGQSFDPKTAEGYDLEISNEIKELTNDSLRKKYLESIHHSDQYYRNNKEDLMDSMGRYSIAVSSASLDMMFNDILNLKRVLSFVDLYGYPTEQIYGETASSAAFLVIHHNYGMPFKYLGYVVLKDAWSNGQLSTDRFDFYLHALLRNFIKSDNKFTIQQLIEIADSQINSD